MNEKEIQACILTALKQEAKPYLKALRQKAAFRHHSFRVCTGYIDDAPVAVAASGVRRRRAATAAQVLIELFPQASIIMSGTAGGLDKRLVIGDTVIATESINHDLPDDETAYPSAEILLERCRKALEKNQMKQQVYYGRLATGDAFVGKNNRASIIERFAPLCVDMETAAAAKVCKANNVPFIAVRSITDVEEDVSMLTFFRNVASAANNSFLVVEAMLRTLQANGSPRPEFKTDEDRSYLIVTIHPHEAFRNGDAPNAPVNGTNGTKSGTDVPVNGTDVPVNVPVNGINVPVNVPVNGINVPVSRRDSVLGILYETPSITLGGLLHRQNSDDTVNTKTAAGATPMLIATSRVRKNMFSDEKKMGLLAYPNRRSIKHMENVTCTITSIVFERYRFAL